MAIRIADATPGVTATPPASAARATGTTTAAALATDRLLGGSAVELDISLQARQALQTLPTVRADRVEAVRRRLSSGAFKIEPDALAECILGQ